jgi:acetyl esterase/lipase
LLTIGDLDLFYEECVTYAERLQSDGVACELFVTEGGVHGMETLLPASSPGRLHWDSVFAFLGRKLDLNQGRSTPN